MSEALASPVAAPATVRPPLGVGSVVGGSFAIFFRRMPLFILLAFVPLLVTQLLTSSLTGALVGSLWGGPGPVGMSGPGIVATIGIMGLTWLLSALALTVAIGFIVQAAYDARLGRSVRLSVYFRTGMRRMAILLIGSLLALLIIAAASGVLSVPGYWILSRMPLSPRLTWVISMVLSLPGLWAWVVLSVVVPVVMIEGAGLGALRRSAGLTAGYRWPVLGTLVILALCSALMTLAVQAGSMALMFWLLPKLLGPQGLFMMFGLVGGALLQSTVTAVGYGLTFVGIALIYARLREIKEGASVESLAEVFV